MNAKNVLVFTFCLFVLCSCATRVIRGSDTAIINHQTEINRLENELRNRDRAIDNAVRELEDITARSSAMEGTVDEIIGLFDEYQRTVEQLLRDYNSIRNETSTNGANTDCLDNRIHHISGY